MASLLSTLYMDKEGMHVTLYRAKFKPINKKIVTPCTNKLTAETAIRY